MVIQTVFFIMVRDDGLVVMVAIRANWLTVVWVRDR